LDLKISYEEVELITQLKLKDRSAFNTLYDKYAPALYTVILQMNNNKAFANKVILKAFIIFWRSIEDYDPGKGKIFTWMLHITRVTAINETKLPLNKQVLTQDQKSGTDGLPYSTEPAIDNCGLKTIINKLENEQKNLVNLYYYKGLTIDEIAATLSIPEGMVKTKMKTALSELGTLLCKI